MTQRWIKRLQTGRANEQVVEAIEAWEHSSGMRLPNDYRAFMTRYNGGRVYPLMFRHTAREPGDEPNPTEHFLDPLNDWHRVVTWREELGDRLPMESLVIGRDPGLIELVLSLRPHDHGHVYSWVRNHGGTWSSPENDYLCLQAPSFRTFVESLYEDEDGDGHDYWDMQSGEPEACRLDF
ncbi:MAG: SMI1/KNR4 family protein [Candidatus Devosia phytovorans]|uniref:SMI1/KNR4 family protein n=1 Tax=Candidatus Devosia phytovorans TaxID=3121372 RepID=A0AAJ5VYV3_9HYPH|nr:SMI1/KNR4 family protein [Devosia sp.]WEK05957.1 MAG: SMI1/KNR4 family protein [Devosia sp.]